jgi:hypothetical protein
VIIYGYIVFKGVLALSDNLNTMYFRNNLVICIYYLHITNE